MLTQAAIHNRSNVIEVLVELGADLEAVDEEGKNSLHLASELGLPEAVSCLLDASKNVVRCIVISDLVIRDLVIRDLIICDSGLLINVIVGNSKRLKQCKMWISTVIYEFCNFALSKNICKNFFLKICLFSFQIQKLMQSTFNVKLLCI